MSAKTNMTARWLSCSRKVGGNTRFFSEVSAADRARAAGKGINSAGPKYVFGDDSTYQAYQDARSTVDEAQQFHFDDMWNVTNSSTRVEVMPPA